MGGRQSSPLPASRRASTTMTWTPPTMRPCGTTMRTSGRGCMTLKGDAATADRQIIEEAEANGFMACRAIRDALGWDKPGPNGSYYSSALGVAYRWLQGRWRGSRLPDTRWHHGRHQERADGLLARRVRPRVGLQGSAYVERRRHAEWESRRAAAQMTR